jgi:hypothetical protein
VAYTLGTTSGGLTGAGQIAASGLIGVKVNVTAVPTGAGSRPGTPADYFGLGHITPGDANGWDANLPISHTSQLFYPLRDGISVVGYSLEPGVTASLQLLLGQLGASSPTPPWDRGAFPVSLGFSDYAGPHASATTRWTYTVPSGMRLWIASAGASVFRSSIDAPDYCMSFVQSPYANLAIASIRGGAIGLFTHDAMQGPTFLAAGEIIRGYTYCTCGSGTRTVFNVHMAGFVFNA